MTPPLRNSTQQYGWLAITLHWLMAPLVVAMFLLGWWMTSLDYYHSWYHAAPELHKSIGILLLLTLLIRLAWRLSNPRPQLMGKAWEQIIALLVHRLHYLLLLVVMISGYLLPTADGVGISLFGWFTLPATLQLDRAISDTIGTVHLYAAWAAMALIALHAAAALKHHFVDRDTTLLRILGTAQTPTPKEYPQP
ncbi:MAG: cytochrome b [Mariprofundales bacterium]